MSFQNKIIWITGASSGIGEALSYAFAKEGANLILSSRKVDELQKVKANCPDPSVVYIQPLDLADHSDAITVGEDLLKRFGRIDFLINNAGISQRALVKDTRFAVDKKLIDVNFLGTVAVTKSVLPSMIQRNSGHIVVMSSLMGKFSTPLRSSYAASKHALHGFFNALRAELSSTKIRITIICPGYIRTNISINALTSDGSPQNVMDDATARGLSPEEFSQKVLRLIKKGKSEAVIAGPRELLGVYLSRFFPGFFYRIISRMKVT